MNRRVVKLMKPSEFERIRQVGEYTITLPPPPKQKDIEGWERPSWDQYFRPPTEKVRGFNRLSEDEKVDFLVEIVRKRKEGHWFYNNGKIEHCTGVHWFYCAFWYIPGGLPQWRDADRDLFYVWWYVQHNPNCYGLIFISSRRGGKTAKGTCILYEPASRIEEFRAGIQSKTSKDSKSIFLKLVASWKRLPKFLHPIDSGETNPKTELRFEEPGKSSKKGEEKVYKKVLNSLIDYRSSTAEAYDGEEQNIIYHDEIGKTVEVNVYERWEKVKPTLEKGSKIVGKGYLSSTVEDMERMGGANCYELWRDSDIKELDSNGRTKTGCFRIFVSANLGLEGHIDQYGYSVVDTPAEDEEIYDRDGEQIILGATDFIMNRRDNKTGRQLIEEVQKYPLDVEEAFAAAGGTQIFSDFKIRQQMRFNDKYLRPPDVRKCSLYYTDSSKEKVAYSEDPEGLFNIHWLPIEEKRNHYQMGSRGKIPLNTELGVLGTDPFDHKETVDLRRSDAAAYGMLKHNPLDPLGGFFPFMEYCGRPETPEQYYEHMAMACQLWGMQILVENQKPGIITYFRQNNLTEYIMRTKRAEFTQSTDVKLIDGVSLSGNIARTAHINGIITYVWENVGKLEEERQLQMGYKADEVDINRHGRCVFHDLLKDLLIFDPDKWTKYDRTVAFGVTIMALTNNVRSIRKPPVKSLNELFTTFNLQGTRSQRL